MGDVKPPFVAAKKGFAVFMIFFLIAPPVQFLVAVMMLHPWVGGKDLLIEIVQLIREQFLPRILSAYGFYMPVCFTAGLWSAYGVAKGYFLGMGGMILRMVVVGVTFELIIQAFLMTVGVQFLVENLLIWGVQWIISSVVCALVWLKIQKNPFLD